MNDWGNTTNWYRRQHVEHLLKHMQPLQVLDRFMQPPRVLTRREHLFRNLDILKTRIALAWKILRHGEY